MKINKYYQISGVQLFIMAMLMSVISAALVTINITAKEYLLLPEVVLTKDEKCAAVINYKNGDGYSCGDVGVILRNFRKKIE